MNAIERMNAAVAKMNAAIKAFEPAKAPTRKRGKAAKKVSRRDYEDANDCEKKFGFTEYEWVERLKRVAENDMYLQVTGYTLDFEHDRVYRHWEDGHTDDAPLAVKVRSGAIERIGDVYGRDTNEYIIVWCHEDDNSWDSVPTKRAFMLKEKERELYRMMHK